MISKEKAIQILDEFLDLEYNADRFYSTRVKTHRLYVTEKEFFWGLIQSAEEDIYKKEGNIGGIGGGPYFIDKQTGEIFPTGSYVLHDWEQEFIKYKRGEKSNIDWQPKRVTYLECKHESHFKIIFQEITLKCNYLEKEKAIWDFFKINKNEVQKNFNPILINKAFEADEGELILGIKGDFQKHKINLIQKEFTGGLGYFSSTLRDLKKWIRVNGKKLTDNYWIEIRERDFDKEFKNWQLRLNLEFE
ncbi:MAG: hypothetical protein IPN76_19810 [Saprospiraceae bacterium]|nr:hypothetical protein [Saprospiraceae bacterium]